MEINKKNAVLWSRLGMRGTLGLFLYDNAPSFEKLVVMSADLATTSGLDRFKNAYPDKFYNLGIAEQNMMGTATGMAMNGYNVFVTSFANFLTLRSCEQIRLNMGYMKIPLKVVGMSSGFAMGMFGNTHYGIEDISIMRSIPNITVISPADGWELIKCLEKIIKDDSPIYLRLTGSSNIPIVYTEDYDYEIGKAITLKQGEDIALISTGSMVSVALEVSKLLEKDNISATAINVHTIKPLDYNLINKIYNKYKFIFTIEEHSIIGGLGSAVAEYISQFKNHSPLYRIGVPDTFGAVGDYSYMLKQFGLTSTDIYQYITEIYK